MDMKDFLAKVRAIVIDNRAEFSREVSQKEKEQLFAEQNKGTAAELF